MRAALICRGGGQSKFCRKEISSDTQKISYEYDIHYITGAAEYFSQSSCQTLMVVWVLTGLEVALTKMVSFRALMHHEDLK